MGGRRYGIEDCVSRAAALLNGSLLVGLKALSDGAGIHLLLKYSVSPVWCMMSGYQKKQEQGLGSALNCGVSGA